MHAYDALRPIHRKDGFQAGKRSENFEVFDARTGSRS